MYCMTPSGERGARGSLWVDSCRLCVFFTYDMAVNLYYITVINLSSGHNYVLSHMSPSNKCEDGLGDPQLTRLFISKYFFNSLFFYLCQELFRSLSQTFLTYGFSGNMLIFDSIGMSDVTMAHMRWFFWNFPKEFCYVQFSEHSTDIILKVCLLMRIHNYIGLLV